MNNKFENRICIQWHRLSKFRSIQFDSILGLSLHLQLDKELDRAWPEDNGNSNSEWKWNIKHVYLIADVAQPSACEICLHYL